MAEKKAEKKTETADVGEKEHVTKTKQSSRWTEATCLRAAKRFNSRTDWAAGAPSSYKAAVAKGWDTKCCAHMTHKTPMKVAGKTTTKVAKPTTKKTPGKLPKSA